MKEQIRRKIQEWRKIMKESGYKPDLSWSLRGSTDQSKENLLCYHSEKISLALGVLTVPTNETIVITKNLRVCGECHSSTAFISKIENREFLVRDANRWHHFKDGKCDCNNYF